MDVWEAIRGRRSVRTYLEETVPRETLIRLVEEAAIWAPTGGNAQTWRFIIVDDPSLLNKVRMVSPGLSGKPAAVIILCQDMEKARQKSSDLGEIMALLDTGMAAQNVMLAAHAIGLGTCPISSFHLRGVQAVLSLPEKIVPFLLIAVGVPGAIPKAPERKTDVWRFNYEPVR